MTMYRHTLRGPTGKIAKVHRFWANTDEGAVATAREVLLEGELISDEPAPQVVAPGRLLVGLLVALAIGALVVWLASQVVH